MQRVSWVGVTLATAVVSLATFAGRSAGQPPNRDKADIEAAKTLERLFRAYAFHEFSGGKPAQKLEEMPVDPADVKKLRSLFNFDELGVSLVDNNLESLARQVMIYQVEAPQKGGLVLFYDGTIKKLTAAEVKKLLGKGT